MLTYAQFLSKVHAEFFDNFEAKSKSPELLDVKYYIKKCKKSIFENFDQKLNLTLFCYKQMGKLMLPNNMPV